MKLLFVSCAAVVLTLLACPAPLGPDVDNGDDNDDDDERTAALTVDPAAHAFGVISLTQTSAPVAFTFANGSRSSSRAPS